MKQLLKVITNQGLIVEVDLKHIISLNKGDKIKKVKLINK